MLSIGISGYVGVFFFCMKYAKKILGGYSLIKKFLKFFLQKTDKRVFYLWKIPGGSSVPSNPSKCLLSTIEHECKMELLPLLTTIRSQKSPFFCKFRTKCFRLALLAISEFLCIKYVKKIIAGSSLIRKFHKKKQICSIRVFSVEDRQKGFFIFGRPSEDLLSKCPLLVENSPNVFFL